jgi:hypothetical protein
VLSESERSSEQIKTELIPKEETGEGTPETLELQAAAALTAPGPAPDRDPAADPAPESPPEPPSIPVAASPPEPTPESTPVPDPVPVTPQVQPLGPVLPVSPMPQAGQLNPPEAVDPVDPVDIPTGPMSAVELGSLATGPMPLPGAPDYDPSVPRPGFMPPELLARRRPAPHSAAYGMPQLQAPPLPQMQQAPSVVTGSAQLAPGATATAAPTGSGAPSRGHAGPADGSPKRPMAAIVGAVLVLVLIVVAALAFVNRGSGDAPTTLAPTPSATVAAAPVTVKLSGASGIDFTHKGTSFTEKKTGSWESQTYNNSNFGGLKPGIGLVLDLGSAQAVTSVSFSAGSDKYTADLRAADTAASELDGYKQVGDSTTASGSTSFKVSTSAKHRYWLIWVSNLGPTNHAAISNIKIKAAS